MKKIITCAAMLTAAACTESGPDPVYPGLDFVSFSYSAFGGRPGGSFLAAGDNGPEDARIALGDWAGAQVPGSASTPVMVLVGSRSAAGGTYDLLVIHLPRDARTGAVVDATLTCEAAPDCAQISLGFGLTSWPGTAEIACTVRTGQVRVTTRTERRLFGTFSGTAVCSGAALGETQITGGVFDVPLHTLP
ncbi:MAG TPA: hypothetical protein VHG08_06285 [Longimicrobium sp.]|nr:hypothetical protein [Longimicrobium sp.]